MTIFLWAALLQAPGDRCPVLPAEKADPRYTRVHEGRTFRFCCERCVREFEESPGRFLPPDEAPARASDGWILGPVFVPAVLLLAGAGCGWARRRAAAAGLGAAGVFAAGLTFLADRIIEASRPDGVNLGSALGLRLYAYAGLGGLLAAWTAVRFQGLKAALRRPPVLAVLALAVAVLVAFAARFRRDVDAHRVDVVHFATFEDFGRPPVPKPPARPALGGVWYRGNDERDPRLSRGGNYRTCSFTLGLETSDGRPVAAGDPVAGPLWVSLDIDRPPNTKEGLYTPSIFARCFLTKESDAFMGSGGPIPDRTPIETVKPGWKWKARYPLGGTSEGLLYVCEEQWMEAGAFHLGAWRPLGEEGRPRRMMAGGRFHYAIRYALAFRDGRLAPGSVLWMGSLYRARKYTLNEIPAHEWLSQEPIPVADAMERNIVLPESPDREDR